MPGPVSVRRESSAARYETIERLASGGMGVVYRVFDRVAGEERALKRVLPDASAKRFMVEAFEREYQVLATLDHPRIIRVHDYGVDELGPYYTMELLSGRDMRHAAPLPYRDACRHLRDVATSLALLHARRLIHRDLSPGNVRMTQDGHCKLLDFGALANFGVSEFVAGTPPAVPPEALTIAPLDQRADLYSLGALAYWILTGVHAYPAHGIEELPECWKIDPAPPSSVVAGIPRDLDALVLSLLSADPLARPASAAEVIARLAVAGELPPEGSTETRRLALSFLSNPRFVGRAALLARAHARTVAAVDGAGGTVWIEAVAGMGRTRLLEEIGVRAQLAGAVVVRADASTARQSGGTARALVLRLVDALPELARKHAGPHRTELGALGRDVHARLDGGFALSPSESTTPNERRPLEQWFSAISAEKPLVVQVDNVEYADDASVGLLVGLAGAAPDRRIVVVVTECVGRERDESSGDRIGLSTLRAHATPLKLTGLNAMEMLELVRSLFGDAPGVERFAEWLYERTAGSPLHAVELARQLLAKNVIGYCAGVWTLPDRVPDIELPAALGDALSMRLAQLSEPARILAECLSLQRQQSTFELCSLLSTGVEDVGVFTLLDELAERDVVYAVPDGYGFTSQALRDALLAGMDDARLEHNHRRLGEAFARLAGDAQSRLRVEAGWHLIQGGDELRGADMIAAVIHDGATHRELFANLHRIARPLEAALKAYGKHRRSLYARLPLLSGLAQAGYYEDRAWGERYGDEALDAVVELSGVGTARRLRRFLGGWLALLLGLSVAFARFRMTPRLDRPYSFKLIFTQLFSTVSALAGVASLSFDGERTALVADVLEPFSVLPERSTPVGIYQFCRGLREIGAERGGEAYATFDALLRRFQDKRYYPTLPEDARRFYVAGAHFVRGSFGSFRADGLGALESAEALDRMGLKLYALIGSQLRCLFHTMRGDFVKAAAHRERVELQAAHVGSVWQVETWEAAALLLVYPQVGDIVGSTRIAHRLELLSRTVPSMKRYAELAKSAVILSRGEPATTAVSMQIVADYEKHVPRSYIGWAAARGYVARVLNASGDHAEAKSVCEQALSHVSDADQEYVSLFLNVELELAVANAGLGQVDRGIERLDALIARHKASEHRLALGLLHETRAVIAWRAGRVDTYEESLRETERWLLPTQEPTLVAKCHRLSGYRDRGRSGRAPAPGSSPMVKELVNTAISGRPTSLPPPPEPTPKSGS